MKDLEGQHAFSNSAKTWFSDVVLTGGYFLQDPLQSSFGRKKNAYLGKHEVLNTWNIK